MASQNPHGWSPQMSWLPWVATMPAWGLLRAQGDDKLGPVEGAQLKLQLGASVSCWSAEYGQPRGGRGQTPRRPWPCAHR